MKRYNIPLLLLLAIGNSLGYALPFIKSIQPLTTPGFETTEISGATTDSEAQSFFTTTASEQHRCHAYCMANLDALANQTSPSTEHVTNTVAEDVFHNSTEVTVTPKTTAVPLSNENNVDDLVKQSQFDCIFDELDPSVREKHWNGLKEAFESFATFKPQNQNEVIIFLAHVSHETDGLKTVEEYCGKDGSCADKYQGGEGTWCTAVQATPGKKYFGRGWFQLSWPCNYAEAGKALGVENLLDDPDQVAQSEKLAAGTALWYWKEKKMNEPAAQGDFAATTRILNVIECGAENDKQNARVEKYQRVRKCFGLGEETNNLMC